MQVVNPVVVRLQGTHNDQETSGHRCDHVVNHSRSSGMLMRGRSS